MPEPTFRHAAERNRFVLEEDGELLGYVEYERTDDVWDLQHTVIRPRARGRGLGSVLVGSTLEAIRDAGGRFVPTCPFVAEYLERHPEWTSLSVTGPDRDAPDAG